MVGQCLNGEEADLLPSCRYELTPTARNPLQGPLAPNKSPRIETKCRFSCGTESCASCCSFPPVSDCCEVTCVEVSGRGADGTSGVVAGMLPPPDGVVDGKVRAPGLIPPPPPSGRLPNGCGAVDAGVVAGVGGLMPPPSGRLPNSGGIVVW